MRLFLAKSIIALFILTVLGLIGLLWVHEPRLTTIFSAILAFCFGLIWAFDVISEERTGKNND